MKKILNSKTIYDGKIINVSLDEVEVDGNLLIREVVHHRGGASVLAEKDGCFAFVKQYRHPHGRDFLELPAGTRDGNETGEVTALRELQEDCGLKAKKLIHICDFAVSPGYSNEVLHLFYANEFETVDCNLDDDEFLSVEWIDKEKALNMALSGEIIDGKTLTAILWYNVNFFKKVITE